MNRDMTAANASRRSMAIGIWSLLLVLMALAPSEASALSVVVCLLIASTASGIALLLMVSPSSHQVSLRHRSVCVAISFAIPLAWSFLFNARNNPSISLFFMTAAVLPVIGTRLGLMLRVPAADALFPDGQPETQTVLPSKVSEPAGNFSDEVEDEDVVFCHTRKRGLIDQNWTTEATKSPGLREDAPDPATHASRCDKALVTENSDRDLHGMQAIPFDHTSIDREEALSSEVTQWLTRSLTADGEIIEGGIRIEFAEGQRDATVHISFCPPLTGVPDVTTEDLDGCDLEIRVSAAYPFGARITARRTSSSASDGKRMPVETCRIGFVAIAASLRRAA
jgi:hypothetical protein